MSSPLVTGGSIALKSKLNGKYLRYLPENGKILEMSGEDVLSPYTRFRAEPSKKHDGHVHIRCCYNNKYWVARELNQELCLMGDANEPQEDLSDPSCTLLRHEPNTDHVDNVNYVSLQHARLKRIVYMLTDAHPTEKTLRAGSLLLGEKDKPDGDTHKFSVIDLDGYMVLPENVCFKGDNGLYLRAEKVEWDLNYLQFSMDDIGDPTVRNIIYPNNDGTIRIYSSHYGKYWRRSPNWIWGDSDDTTSRNPDTVFRVVYLGDGAKIALQNLGNNYYCKRLTMDGKTDCLNAGVSTINKYAQLELYEAVIFRKIYDVEYHLDDVTTRLKPRTFGSDKKSNKTSTPFREKLIIPYSVKTDKRWDSNVSWKLGVKTTITAGIPEIAQVSIEIQSEFSDSYTWGETLSETTENSNEEEVEVPPYTEMTVSVLGTEGNCDIPFSYTQEDLLYTGEKRITRMHDGIFTGVNCYGFKTEITE